MDTGDVLLFLHIIGAAGWIGGATFAYFFLGQLAKEGGAERGRNMESFMDRLRQYGAVAIPLVLLTGVGLVLTEDQWSWSDTFVWVGIGAVIVSGIWQGVYARGKDEALVESVITEANDRLGRLRRWNQTFCIEVAIVLVALWAMVTKVEF